MASPRTHNGRQPTAGFVAVQVVGGVEPFTTSPPPNNSPAGGRARRG